MKIILEDKKYNFYGCALTYDAGIELLRLFRSSSYLSLDYDLGGEETGYDILVYMAENGIRTDHINIHSDLSVGVPRMREFVCEHFPNTTLTFNSL